MAKLLCVDIETSPNVAYVWGLHKQNVGLNQLKQPTRILCWAAKWVGSKDMFFGAEWLDGQFMERLHQLLSEADAIITYNGNRFDIPKIQGEFVARGMSPTPPIPSIDLYTTARRLGYPSGKLEYVARHLGLGSKIKHRGFDMWVGVMEGIVSDQRAMERYNKQDVRLLERVYKVLKPFVKSHPYLGEGVAGECPVCKSHHLQSRGSRRTKLYMIERFQCQDCGSWSTGKQTKVPVIKKEKDAEE